MIIEIDKDSGFCFGVRRAVDKAEELLRQGKHLFSLGEMVHNQEEIDRLTGLGMQIIDHSQMDKVKDGLLLFRSHGEPPESYIKASDLNITVIDATCPVVQKLQQRIRKSSLEMSKIDGQVLIYGKENHPETIGLNGQTNNTAIVLSSMTDIDKIDFSRPIELFSQTTMPIEGFGLLVEAIRMRAKNTVQVHNTICCQVANRMPEVEAFARRFDLLIFVCGKNSSNGKMLFEKCLNVNKNSKLVSSPSDVDPQWFNGIDSIGISGATSTPYWLMEQVHVRLTQILKTSI